MGWGALERQKCDARRRAENRTRTGSNARFTTHPREYETQGGAKEWRGWVIVGMHTHARAKSGARKRRRTKTSTGTSRAGQDALSPASIDMWVGGDDGSL